MTKSAFIYETALSRHTLREDHPMRPSRLQYTYELSDAYDAFDGSIPKIVPQQKVTELKQLVFNKHSL